MRTGVTLTLRRRSSGHRVAQLAVDSLDIAWCVANVLARSDEFSRCIVCATTSDGAELWTVGAQPPAPVYATPPQPAYAPPPAPPWGYTPALPQAPAYAAPYPRPAAYPGEVVDAELVEDFPPPPALPPRRW
jgi:hypothetical protein